MPVEDGRYGRFDYRTGNFVISDPCPPRPWLNILSNGSYVCLVTQTGGGYSFVGDERHRVSAWRRDSGLLDRPGRSLYIKNHGAHSLWSPGWQPVQKVLDRWLCEVGLAYSRLEGELDGLKVQVTTFVPGKGSCEVWLVRLENMSGEEQRLDIYPFVELLLGSPRVDAAWGERAALLNRAAYDPALPALLAWTSARVEQGKVSVSPAVTFVATSLRVQDWETRKGAFIGSGGTLAHPAGIRAPTLACGQALGEDVVAVFRHSLELDLDEVVSFTVVVGQARSQKEVAPLARPWLDPIRAGQEVERLSRACRIRATAQELHPPDNNLDHLMIRWLAYGAEVSDLVGREVSLHGANLPGQSWRQALQGARLFALTDPPRAKERLLLMASAILSNGMAPGRWDPCSRRSLMGPWSPGHPLWLAEALMTYCEETGDRAILEEGVTILDRADPLIRGPLPSNSPLPSALVADALARTIEFTLSRRSERGLASGTDEASAMAEDVVQTMALVRALDLASRLYGHIDQDNRAARFRGAREGVIRSIKENGWVQDRYILGYTREGQPVGAPGSSVTEIALAPAVWAVLSDLGQGDRNMGHLAHQALHTIYGYRCSWPTHSAYRPEAGLSSAFPPGFGRNGGISMSQNVEVIRALLLQGRGTEAFLLIRSLLPAARQDLQAYEEVPYALSDWIVGPEHPFHGGAGRMPWVGETSANLFVTLVTALFGLAGSLEGPLRINPVVPASWSAFQATRTYRGATYRVSFENPEGVESGVRLVEVDGVALQGTAVGPFTDQREHKVRVIMGRTPGQ